MSCKSDNMFEFLDGIFRGFYTDCLYFRVYTQLCLLLFGIRIYWGGCVLYSTWKCACALCCVRYFNCLRTVGQIADGGYYCAARERVRTCTHAGAGVSALWGEWVLLMGLRMPPRTREYLDTIDIARARARNPSQCRRRWRCWRLVVLLPRDASSCLYTLYFNCFLVQFSCSLSFVWVWNLC